MSSPSVDALLLVTLMWLRNSICCGDRVIRSLSMIGTLLLGIMFCLRLMIYLISI